jgi:hypothetical protein
MILSPLAFVLTSMSLTPMLHAEEVFHPEGNWTIQFQNSCSASSTYSHLPRGQTVGIKGGDFVCSSYLPKERVPEKDVLTVRFNPETNAIELTGGPSGLPRSIRLDWDKVGVSNVKLFPKTTPQSPGCDLKSYELETVKFTGSNDMLYGYVTVYEFIPRQSKGCDTYLSELKSAIERRTATGLLLATRDANAVSVDHLQNLAALNIFKNYKGTRNLSG